MDKVAEFLTVIRNAGGARHEKVDVPASKMRAGIATILASEGFIRNFKVAKDSKQGVMRLYLKYDDAGKHVIQAIDKVSTPGRRVYIKSTDIPVVRSGKGMCIVSTSKGIMSGREASQKNLGGELLCTIW